MGKEDELIMVVKKKDLFEEDEFEGFLSNSNGNKLYDNLLDSYKFMRRGDAEKDYDHKQPITYCIIINKDKGVYSYQRSNEDKDYYENRLQGKFSWGVGGHIDKADVSNGNPILTSLSREVDEEVNIIGDDVDTENFELLGYINDNKTDVGKVHIGVMFIYYTNSEKIEPNDGEIANGEFRSIKELKNIIQNYDVESWSEIALDELERLHPKL